MPKDDAAIDEIKALEDRRYRACSPAMPPCSTNSVRMISSTPIQGITRQGAICTRLTRYFTYLEITHPVDRILVVDGAALVVVSDGQGLGRWPVVHVDNRYLAVDAVASLPVDSCIIDGEAIVMDQSGLSIFDLLRYRQHDHAALCAPSTSLNSMVRTCGRDRSRSASSTWRGHYARPIPASSSTRPIPATAR